MYKVILTVVFSLFLISCNDNTSVHHHTDTNKSAFHPFKISNISLSDGSYPYFLTNNTPFYTATNENGTLFVGAVNADGTSKEIALLEENNNSYFGVTTSMDANYIVACPDNREDLYLYKIESNLTVRKTSSLKIDPLGSDTIMPDAKILDISNNTIAVSELQTVYDEDTDDEIDVNKVIILNIDTNGTMSIVQKIQNDSVEDFGASLVLDGDTLAISDMDSNIYIYQKDDNGTFTKTDTFNIGDTSSGKLIYLSLDKNYLLVKVRHLNKVSLYELQNGKKESSQEIIPEDDLNFVDGDSQAIYNNTILLNTCKYYGQPISLSVYTIKEDASQTTITKKYDINTTGKIASFKGTQFILHSFRSKNFDVYDTNPLNKIYIYSDKNPKIKLDEEEVYSPYSIDADSPNGGLEYSLSGVDATYFKLIGNSLYPIAPLDYENPLDSNMDNNYSLAIDVVDAKDKKATINVNVEVVNREYLLKERKVADDSAQNTYLGKSLFIDNKDVIVGANASAYLLQVNNNKLNQILKITSDSNESSFGSSIAKSSNHVLVGAPQEDINDTDQGAIYLYEIDENKTHVLSKIKIDMQTLPPHALFGHAVALDESVAIVSARGAGFSYRYPGKVFIYSRELNGSLSLKQTLKSPNSQIEDYFGESLALNSEYLLVGSPQHSFENRAYVGAVYLYKRETNTTMTLVDTLTPNDSTFSQYYGDSVAVDGKYIVVGAPGVNDVYVYKISLSGDHADKLVTLHNENTHWFGSAVSIKGKDIVIGTLDGSDIVYHYTIKDDDRVVLTESILEHKQSSRYADHSLAIGNNFFISGNPAEDVNATDTGALYLFVKE